MAPLSGLLGGHVDQVALIVPDLESAMDGYTGSLGVSFHQFDVDQDMGSFSGSSAQFRVRIAVAQVGTCSIELIQPASGVTFYSKHLETHAPGVHHFGVYVDDLAKARPRTNHRSASRYPWSPLPAWDVPRREAPCEPGPNRPR